MSWFEKKGFGREAEKKEIRKNARKDVYTGTLKVGLSGISIPQKYRTRNVKVVHIEMMLLKRNYLGGKGDKKFIEKPKLTFEGEKIKSKQIT